MSDLAASRRGFMFGAGALLTAQPKMIRARLPTIYGDGLRDDWEGLQSLMFGRPVRLPDGDTFSPGRSPILLGGVYRLSQTLFADERANGLSLHGVTLHSDHNEHVLHIQNAQDIVLHNLTVIGDLPFSSFGDGQNVTVCSGRPQRVRESFNA